MNLALSKSPSSYIVLTGDYGGIIYFTGPAKLVKCGRRQLETVLRIIDRKVVKDYDGTSIAYRMLSAGDEVEGGSAGALAEEGFWFHPMVPLREQRRVEKILLGRTLVKTITGNLSARHLRKSTRG